ncbi:MAG: hypothetical protein IJT35_06245 [Paludibacteraceae bacterium]|nr:hypothetical protein [Paludibacteraceae bacterium]
MKKEYTSPQTGIENTTSVQMLCASGITPPASHDTEPGLGGDPNLAI